MNECVNGARPHVLGTRSLVVRSYHRGLSLVNYLLKTFGTGRFSKRKIMADTRYWSKEFMTNFIEEYKSHPCLWKIKAKEYTNKNLKNEAYEKLVNMCKNVFPEANRDFVVKKIQSMRGSFRKELKKVEGSKRSGSSTDDVYTPSLWYFDLFLFTKDQETPTESVSNISYESEEVDNLEDQGLEQDEDELQLSEASRVLEGKEQRRKIESNQVSCQVFIFNIKFCLCFTFSNHFILKFYFAVFIEILHISFTNYFCCCRDVSSSVTLLYSS